jgi:hypothetical protein
MVSAEDFPKRHPLIMVDPLRIDFRPSGFGHVGRVT